jgi:hypothetical protein
MIPHLIQRLLIALTLSALVWLTIDQIQIVKVFCAMLIVMVELQTLVLNLRSEQVEELKEELNNYIHRSI